IKRVAPKQGFKFSAGSSNNIVSNKPDGTTNSWEHRSFPFVVGAGNAHVRRNVMTSRFLISAAAAALIAGTGFANAQGTGTSREGASGGAATQQTAPSSGGAMNRDSGMKGAESAKGSESKE